MVYLRARCIPPREILRRAERFKLSGEGALLGSHCSGDTSTGAYFPHGLQ